MMGERKTYLSWGSAIYNNTYVVDGMHLLPGKVLYRAVACTIRTRSLISFPEDLC